MKIAAWRSPPFRASQANGPSDAGAHEQRGDQRGPGGGRVNGGNEQDRDQDAADGGDDLQRHELLGAHRLAHAGYQELLVDALHVVARGESADAGKNLRDERPEGAADERVAEALGELVRVLGAGFGVELVEVGGRICRRRLLAAYTEGDDEQTAEGGKQR